MTHKSLKKGENQSELMPVNERDKVARRSRKTRKIQIGTNGQQEFPP